MMYIIFIIDQPFLTKKCNAILSLKWVILALIRTFQHVFVFLNLSQLISAFIKQSFILTKFRNVVNFDKST